MSVAAVGSASVPRARIVWVVVAVPDRVVAVPNPTVDFPVANNCTRVEAIATNPIR